MAPGPFCRTYFLGSRTAQGAPPDAPPVGVDHDRDLVGLGLLQDGHRQHGLERAHELRDVQDQVVAADLLNVGALDLVGPQPSGLDQCVGDVGTLGLPVLVADLQELGQLRVLGGHLAQQLPREVDLDGLGVVVDLVELLHLLEVVQPQGEGHGHREVGELLGVHLDQVADGTVTVLPVEHEDLISVPTYLMAIRPVPIQLPPLLMAESYA